MYCAVSALFNTVDPVSISESLVQVTVVAGPPVEIQVRVNRGLAPLRLEWTVNITSSDIVIFPIEKHGMETV